MNPELQQAIEELQQITGPLDLFSDYGDWAEVVNDDEFVVVTDPRAYFDHLVTESYDTDWLARTALRVDREYLLGRVQDRLSENAGEAWYYMMKAPERHRNEIVDFIEWILLSDDPEDPLDALERYAQENPDYEPRGLRKPRQRTDRFGNRKGPSPQEWRQMSGRDKLLLVSLRPTPVHQRWAQDEIRHLAEMAYEQRDPRFFDPEEAPYMAALYGDARTEYVNESDVLEYLSDDDFRSALTGLDVAYSPEDWLTLVGVEDARQLPGGAYWWEVD